MIIKEKHKQIAVITLIFGTIGTIVSVVGIQTLTGINEKITFSNSALEFQDEVTFTSWVTPSAREIPSGLIGNICFKTTITNTSENRIHIADIQCLSNGDYNYIESILHGSGEIVSLPIVLDAGELKEITFVLQFSVPENVVALIEAQYTNSPFDKVHINMGQLDEYLGRNYLDVFGNTVRNFFDENSSLFKIHYDEGTSPVFPVYQLSLGTSRGNSFSTDVKYTHR